MSVELCDGAVAVMYDRIVVRADGPADEDGWCNGEILELPDHPNYSALRVGGRLNFHKDNVASVVRPSGLILSNRI